MRRSVVDAEKMRCGYRTSGKMPGEARAGGGIATRKLDVVEDVQAKKAHLPVDHHSTEAMRIFHTLGREARVCDRWRESRPMGSGAWRWRGLAGAKGKSGSM